MCNTRGVASLQEVKSRGSADGTLLHTWHETPGPNNLVICAAFVIVGRSVCSLGLCLRLLRVNDARAIHERRTECCCSSFRDGSGGSFRLRHTSASFAELIGEHALSLQQPASSEYPPPGVAATG